MTANEILTLVALVVVPISAVLIGQYLQDRAKKREEKMQIFKILMTTRIYGWTENGVQAMNLIDVVFSRSQTVRAAWSDYRSSLNVTTKEAFNARDAQTKQWKLLEAISNDLGYKDKITWETIQNPYVPDGLFNMWEEQSKTKKAQAQSQEKYDKFLDAAVRAIPPSPTNANKSEETYNIIAK